MKTSQWKKTHNGPKIERHWLKVRGRGTVRRMCVFETGGDNWEMLESLLWHFNRDLTGGYTSRETTLCKNTHHTHTHTHIQPHYIHSLYTDTCISAVFIFVSFHWNWNRDSLIFHLRFCEWIKVLGLEGNTVFLQSKVTSSSCTNSP